MSVFYEQTMLTTFCVAAPCLTYLRVCCETLCWEEFHLLWKFLSSVLDKNGHVTLNRPTLEYVLFLYSVYPPIPLFVYLTYKRTTLVRYSLLLNTSSCSKIWSLDYIYHLVHQVKTSCLRRC